MDRTAHHVRGAMTLEPLDSADTAELAALWRRSREGAQPWLEQRMGYTPAEDHAQMRDVIARESDVWVARGGRRLLGFLALAGVRVEHLYVDPTAQSAGIGRVLLARARELSPSELTLFTHRRNTGARAFYERFGFHPIAFATSPPPESEPDILYRWTSHQEPVSWRRMVPESK